MTNKTLRTIADLAAENLVSSNDIAALTEVAQKYAVAISPHLLELIKQEPKVAKQFVPTKYELDQGSNDLHDPIGDQSNSPVKGIIHRYPDRCLLQPVTVCPVYCRFCFRREVVGQGNAALNDKELANCYSYIKSHPEIWEVILSGGDPLILKPKKLSAIISSLDSIPHVEIIRIHTRVPVLDPKRIDTTMLSVLTKRKPIYIVLHINHPGEFSEQAIDAINKLADSGIVLLGQTVLLKGVNDNVGTMGALMRTMVKHRIKPYYLHHVDLAVGTKHFRTSISTGQDLVAGLRGRYSGLCQPEYVLDIPGGAGKVPIGPSYLHADGDSFSVTNFQGKAYKYQEES